MNNLILKTPWWKEVLVALFVLGGTTLGVLFVLLAFPESDWFIVALGVCLIAVGLAGFFREITSRTVLIADEKGIYTHAYAFARKRRTPWPDIAGFEKSVQTSSHRGIVTMSHTYLVIRLKNPTAYAPTGAMAFFAETLGVNRTMDKPFVAGDIYMPMMRLPGRVDDLIAQLERYRSAFSR